MGSDPIYFFAVHVHGRRAELAIEAGPLHRQLPARRQLRPDRALDRAEDRREARPAGGGREQARRRRQYRRRRGGEELARRSHHRPRRGGRAVGEPEPLSGHAVRSAERSRAGLDAGDDSLLPRRAPVAEVHPRRGAARGEDAAAAYESFGWLGPGGPAGTPAAIISRLNAEITAALAAPDVREKALAAGAEPLASSPQEFAAFIRDEARKWADVIQKAGVKLE